MLQHHYQGKNEKEKCPNKFDCFICEMLIFTEDLKKILNLQTDSISTKYLHEMTSKCSSYKLH